MTDYIDRATGAGYTTVTLAMIETKTAMGNLDAVAAVPGIDVLFVGPSDLSIGLTDGKELDPHSDTVEAALDKIVAACRKAGKYVGICGQGPSDHPDLARWLLQQGIESMSLNPDTVVETWMFLANEAKA